MTEIYVYYDNSVGIIDIDDVRGGIVVVTIDFRRKDDLSWHARDERSLGDTGIVVVRWVSVACQRRN